MRILVVKTSSLGDVIHTFPAVHALRERFPMAQIDWLVNPSFIPIVSAHPDVDEVIPYPRSAFSNLLTLLPWAQRLISRLRKGHYDVVIDFQGLFRTAIFAGFSRGIQVIGYENPREGIARYFYKEKYFVPSEMHAVRRSLTLAQKAFGSSDEIVWPELRLADSLKADAEKILPPPEPGERTIGIVPGARWESKKWPVSFFVSLIETMSMRNAKVRFAIIGGPDDVALASEILTSLGTNIRVISAAGKTDTAVLLALIQCCDVLVSSDTGPLHIAVAQNVPTFSLFGPNDPAYSGPSGATHRVYRSHLSCSPCLKRICPLDTRYPPCHATLNPIMIATEIIEFLEEKS